MGSSCLPIAIVVFVSSIALAAATHPRVWYVGGDCGWVVNPSEPYDQWAGRTRFHVDDKLVFKYEKGKDSVLEVTKEAFATCNLTSPMKNLSSGESVVPLEKNGPLFFISGADGHCQKGQKLQIIVLSREKITPPATPPVSTPVGQPVALPPHISPPVDLPSPAVSPPVSDAAYVSAASLVVGVVGLGFALFLA